jgi:hypothetical protein
MWASKLSRSETHPPARRNAGNWQFSLSAWLLIGLLALLLSGCVTLNDPEASQEYSTSTVGAVSAGQSIGQTFIARRGRLNGITLWFSTGSSQETNATLSFKLFRAGEGAIPVFSTTISTSGIVENSSRYIAIPAQAGRPARYITSS